MSESSPNSSAASPAGASRVLGAVILAAGKGKRMNSDLPKVAHPVADRPMVWWVVQACREVGASPIVLVVGHGAEVVRDIFKNPLHPYTRGLLAATPRPERGARARRQRLNSIKGLVPSLLDVPTGCAFAPRCDEALAECRSWLPTFVSAGEGREVSCLRCSSYLRERHLVGT